MAGQTLVYALLLASVGSLASYLLYRQLTSGYRRGTVVFASLVAGTGSLIAALLLFAVGAHIVSKLRPAAVATPDQPVDTMREPGSMRRASPFQAGTEQVTSEQARQLGSASVSPDVPKHRAARLTSLHPVLDRRTRPSDASEDGVSAEPGPDLRVEELLRQVDVRAAASATTGDMWSATKCVVPIRRDSEEARRWTIVNDCGAPVAILLASCENDENECTRRASWVYSINEIVFPAKYQRPVTEAEVIRYGLHVDHAACVLTSIATIRLIGMDDETRASASWRDAFETASFADGCIIEARRLLAIGMSSRVPPSMLLVPHSQQ